MSADLKEEGYTAKQSGEILNQIKKYNPKLAETLENLDCEQAQQRLAFSNLIKKASAPNASSADKNAVRAAGAKLQELGEKINATIDDALRSCGYPEVDIQASYAADQYESDLSLESDISLKNYTPTNTPSTGKIDAILPDVLNRLLSLAPSAWLNAERQKPYRLDKSYLSEPLSIVSGARVESVLSPVHRFAQALLVSQDFLSEREDYDFHAGALLVPQTTQLGASFEILTTQVCGNVDERIASLSTGPSSNVDSTIYELLVSAACQKYGRQVEMLRPGQTKTPDIRVIDEAMPMPTVVECKRRQFLIEYEKAEERQVRAMYHATSTVLRSHGIFGVVEVEFVLEVAAIPIGEFASSVVRQARYGLERAEAVYPWGKVKFSTIPSRLEFGTTKLYSPVYLDTVFGWNGDVPEFDGIVCQSMDNKTLITSRAVEPIALKWRSRSPDAQNKKQRAINALLSDAASQVPAGEIGIFYICYQEGASEDMADGRSVRLKSEVRDWYHRRGISIPAFFVNRLYPRALGHGAPDLIENVIQMKSYGVHPSIFDLFPTCIFTNG